MNIIKAFIARIVSLFKPVPELHPFSASDSFEEVDAKITGEK